MKTGIFEIEGRYFTKTGKVLIYEEFSNIFDDDGDIVDCDYLVGYYDEIVDVCTGEKYAYDGVLYHEINNTVFGDPIDAYNERRAPNKRGRHSRSNNKQAARLARKLLSWKEDLPF